MNKYLFLDFDGVINSQAYIDHYMSKFDHPSGEKLQNQNFFDPELVKKINTILDKTGAKVVVSSSWGKVYTISQLQYLLDSRGFSHKILSKTEKLQGSERGYEIQKWLDDHAGVVTTFCILDDNPIGPLTSMLVKTSFETGITEDNVEECIRILNDA